MNSSGLNRFRFDSLLHKVKVCRIKFRDVGADADV